MSSPPRAADPFGLDLVPDEETGTAASPPAAGQPAVLPGESPWDAYVRSRGGRPATPAPQPAPTPAPAGENAWDAYVRTHGGQAATPQPGSPYAAENLPEPPRPKDMKEFMGLWDKNFRKRVAGQKPGDTGVIPVREVLGSALESLDPDFRMTKSVTKTIVDKLMMGQYASAEFSYNLVKALKSGDPAQIATAVGPIGTARAIAYALGKGFAPLSDITTGRSYSDVIAEAGIKNPIIRMVGGVLGDIFLDPSFYIAPFSQTKLGKLAEIFGGAVRDVAKGAELGAHAKKVNPKAWAEIEDILAKHGEEVLRPADTMTEAIQKGHMTGLFGFNRPVGWKVRSKIRSVPLHGEETAKIFEGAKVGEPMTYAEMTALQRFQAGENLFASPEALLAKPQFTYEMRIRRIPIPAFQATVIPGTKNINVGLAQATAAASRYIRGDVPSKIIGLKQAQVPIQSTYHFIQNLMTKFPRPAGTSQKLMERFKELERIKEDRIRAGEAQAIEEINPVLSDLSEEELQRLTHMKEEPMKVVESGNGTPDSYLVRRFTTSNRSDLLHIQGSVEELNNLKRLRRRMARAPQAIPQGMFKAIDDRIALGEKYRKTFRETTSELEDAINAHYRTLDQGEAWIQKASEGRYDTPAVMSSLEEKQDMYWRLHGRYFNPPGRPEWDRVPPELPGQPPRGLGGPIGEGPGPTAPAGEALPPEGLSPGPIAPPEKSELEASKVQVDQLKKALDAQNAETERIVKDVIPTVGNNQRAGRMVNEALRQSSQTAKQLQEDLTQALMNQMRLKQKAENFAEIERNLSQAEKLVRDKNIADLDILKKDIGGVPADVLKAHRGEIRDVNQGRFLVEQAGDVGAAAELEAKHQALTGETLAQRAERLAPGDLQEQRRLLESWRREAQGTLYKRAQRNREAQVASLKKAGLWMTDQPVEFSGKGMTAKIEKIEARPGGKSTWKMTTSDSKTTATISTQFGEKRELADLAMSRGLMANVPAPKQGVKEFEHPLPTVTPGKRTAAPPKPPRPPKPPQEPPAGAAETPPPPTVPEGPKPSLPWKPGGISKTLEAKGTSYDVPGTKYRLMAYRRTGPAGEAGYEWQISYRGTGNVAVSGAKPEATLEGAQKAAEAKLAKMQEPSPPEISPTKRLSTKPSPQIPQGERPPLPAGFEEWPISERAYATSDFPHAKDTPPERTSSGDVVLYHGTNQDAARSIAKSGIKPDDFSSAGIGTRPGAVQVFASMKSKSGGGRAIVRIEVDKDWFRNADVTREVGGSGRDQFLVRGGIPREAIRKVDIYGGIDEIPTTETELPEIPSSSSTATPPPPTYTARVKGQGKVDITIEGDTEKGFSYGIEFSGTKGGRVGGMRRGGFESHDAALNAAVQRAEAEATGISGKHWDLRNAAWSRPGLKEKQAALTQKLIEDALRPAAAADQAIPPVHPAPALHPDMTPPTKPVDLDAAIQLKADAHRAYIETYVENPEKAKATQAERQGLQSAQQQANDAYEALREKFAKTKRGSQKNAELMIQMRAQTVKAEEARLAEAKLQEVQYRAMLAKVALEGKNPAVRAAAMQNLGAIPWEEAKPIMEAHFQPELEKLAKKYAAGQDEIASAMTDALSMTSNHPLDPNAYDLDFRMSIARRQTLDTEVDRLVDDYHERMSVKERVLRALQSDDPAAAVEKEMGPLREKVAADKLASHAAEAVRKTLKAKADAELIGSLDKDLTTLPKMSRSKKIDDYWGGNVAADNAGYVTDGHIAIPTKALAPKAKGLNDFLKFRREGEVRAVPNNIVSKVYAPAVKNATKEGRFLGHAADVGPVGRPAAIYVDSEGMTHILDSRKLRTLFDATGFDELRFAGPKDAAAAYRNGKPVGIIMPLKGDLDAQAAEAIHKDMMASATESSIPVRTEMPQKRSLPEEVRPIVPETEDMMGVPAEKIVKAVQEEAAYRAGLKAAANEHFGVPTELEQVWHRGQYRYDILGVDRAHGVLYRGAEAGTRAEALADVAAHVGYDAPVPPYRFKGGEPVITKTIDQLTDEELLQFHNAGKSMIRSLLATVRNHRGSVANPWEDLGPRLRELFRKKPTREAFTSEFVDELIYADPKLLPRVDWLNKYYDAMFMAEGLRGAKSGYRWNYLAHIPSGEQAGKFAWLQKSLGLQPLKKARFEFAREYNESIRWTNQAWARAHNEPGATALMDNAALVTGIRKAQSVRFIETFNTLQNELDSLGLPVEKLLEKVGDPDFAKKLMSGQLSAAYLMEQAGYHPTAVKEAQKLAIELARFNMGTRRGQLEFGMMVNEALALRRISESAPLEFKRFIAERLGAFRTKEARQFAEIWPKTQLILRGKPGLAAESAALDRALARVPTDILMKEVSDAAKYMAGRLKRYEDIAPRVRIFMTRGEFEAVQKEFAGTAKPGQLPFKSAADVLEYMTALEEGAKPGKYLISVDWDLFEKITEAVRKKQVRAWIIPEGIGQSINRALEMGGKNSYDAWRFVSGLHRINNWYKAWTLAIFPEYHLRNVITNLWVNHAYAGMTDWGLYDPAAKIAYRAMIETNPESRVLQGLARLKPPDVRVSIPGFTEKELKTLAEEYGVLQHGFFGADIEQTIEEKILRQGNLGQKILRGGGTVDLGLAIGRYYENTARMGLWLDGLMQGLRPYEAAMRMKKFLFDYTELSEFEKVLMRLFSPFYSWARKNLPLQIEMMIQRPWAQALPAKFAENLQAGMELLGTKEPLTSETAALPSYVQEGYPIKTLEFKTAKGGRSAFYFPLLNYLPLYDLIRYGELAPWYGQITPFVTAPLNAFILKNDPYTGRPIERRPGETERWMGNLRLRRRDVYFLNQSRLLATMDRVLTIKDPTQKEAAWQRLFRAFGVLSGLRPAEIQIRKDRILRLRQIEEQIFALRKQQSAERTKQHRQGGIRIFGVRDQDFERRIEALKLKRRALTGALDVRRRSVQELPTGTP